MNKKQLLAAVAACVLLWAWTMPSGVGEYRSSPDGKWTAYIDHLNRGTYFGREDYLQLRIRRTSDERAILECKVLLLDGDTAPTLAERSRRHIEWSPNSTDVTFTLANERTQTFELPGPTFH